MSKLKNFQLLHRDRHFNSKVLPNSSLLSTAQAILEATSTEAPAQPHFYHPKPVQSAS